MQEQEGAPGALFVREAMGRATEELAEPPGLTAGAVREGRRRRLRARLAVGGAAVCTAALAATGLAALPGTGGGSGGDAGPAPLQMAAAPAAGPRVFPTTTVVPTASPDPSASGPAVPEAERLRIEDFRQRSANVLHDLLPAEVGSISLLSDHVSDYLGESPRGDLLLRLSVRPHTGGGPPDGPCTNTPVGQEVRVKTSVCKRVRVTDTVTGTTWRAVDGDGLTTTSVSFRLGSSDVYVGIMPYGKNRLSSPVPVDQVVAFAQQPRVMALLDEGDRHPVEEAQLSGPAYEE
ncbi:hypothetical protein OU787_17035 [Kitasatospora sp. YST-16]|uniref:hypothetical protein n=1 Tax=Kitasatospora sp. YST-16 TaxID=2998080 RepID=UPI0022833B32|nr:hypothetical protein [Kitasatospora sp. YST-16]WAL73061.1 hypothetical protein OU787_17035 [Kitasatospora sp. YST-16]WNW39113.1 hypothetical protein RKE32_16990 [Streptomyces sp. Li-HN-5-13]